MNQDSQYSEKQLAGFKQTRIQLSDGIDQDKYVLVWKDGSETAFSSLDAIPAKFQRAIQKMKRSASLDDTVFNANLVGHQLVRKRHPRRKGGSRFSLHWMIEPDKLRVEWPSLGRVGSFGAFFLLAAVYFGFDTYYSMASWPGNPTTSLTLSIAAAAIGLLAFCSAYLFEERFEIHTNRVTASRWPALFRPARVRPRQDVIDARVELRWQSAEESDNLSSVHVRVRAPNGIEWWRVGGSLSWNEAQSLGHTLKNYMDVRFDEHGRDDLW